MRNVEGEARKNENVRERSSSECAREKGRKRK